MGRRLERSYRQLSIPVMAFSQILQDDPELARTRAKFKTKKYLKITQKMKERISPDQDTANGAQV